MEEDKQSIFARISGIVRLVVFIILVVLLAFFIIRFVRSRQASNRAEEAVKTARNDQKQDSTDNSDRDEAASEGSRDNEQVEDTPKQLPSGVAESDLPEPQTVGSAVLPAAGMGEDTLITTVVIGLLAYTAMQFKATKRQLSNLQ